MLRFRHKNQIQIYIPTENINPNIKAGDLIKAGTSSYNCIQSGEIVKVHIPKEVLGIELLAVAIPVKDDKGEVISFIKNIASRTNLLGLNASIERPGAVMQAKDLLLLPRRSESYQFQVKNRSKRSMRSLVTFIRQ